MSEKARPVFSAETLHVDTEHSHALIALRGINKRTVNRRSTTLYRVLSGVGIMEVDGVIHELSPGVIVDVPPDTPYRDEGNLDLEAVCIPPFNISYVHVVE